MHSSFLVAFINLFFIPLIPVFFFYRKNSKPIVLSMEFFSCYGMTAVFLIPIAKAIALVLGKFMGAHIDLESSYYTVAAIIAAGVLLVLASVVSRISFQVEFIGHEKRSDEKQTD